MKKYIIIIIMVIAALTALSFVSLWTVKDKSGSIRVNTWDKIKINHGDLMID